MKAIRKKPGCAPEIIEVDNTLKALQAEVGGYIETVTIARDAVIISAMRRDAFSVCRTTAGFSAWISSVRCSSSAPRATSSATCRRRTS